MRSRLLPRLLLLAGLLLALSPLGPAAGPAVASCPAPYLELEPGQVLAGSFEVTGRAFVDGCRDSGGCAQVGCSTRCTWDDPEPQPLTDVALTLRQAGRTWILAETDADDAGRVSFTTTLPPDAKPGRAVLTAVGEGPYVVRLAP